VTGARIVDQNIKVTGFGERYLECLLDGTRVGQIETNWVASRHLWDAFQIARCAPNLVTLRYE
jgi:hypothetical protein